MNNPPVCMTIAGSDSGAGAGIQADLKTFASLGGYGVSVITALTAQNTSQVAGIFPVAADFVSLQMETLFEDFQVDVIKIGMLYQAEIVTAVQHSLKSFPGKWILLDPIFYSSSGMPLLSDDAWQTMIEKLFPMVTLLTPNLAEASLLAEAKLVSRKDIEQAGKTIIEMGPQAVLIKGGHATGNQCSDCLMARTKNGELTINWFSQEKITTNNTHGTGCTLSAAIATYLATGHSLVDAIQQGKNYLTQALLAGKGWKIGRGNGPLSHFFNRDQQIIS